MKEFGIKIHSALVIDINPDSKVKNAMNEINANKRLRIAAHEKAEADKIIVVKQAEGEAESKFLQGQGSLFLFLFLFLFLIKQDLFFTSPILCVGNQHTQDDIKKSCSFFV